MLIARVCSGGWREMCVYICGERRFCDGRSGCLKMSTLPLPFMAQPSAWVCSPIPCRTSRHPSPSIARSQDTNPNAPQCSLPPKPCNLKKSPTSSPSSRPPLPSPSSSLAQATPSSLLECHHPPTPQHGWQQGGVWRARRLNPRPGRTRHSPRGGRGGSRCPSL